MGLTVIPATATTAGGQQVFRATSILATDVVAVAHVTTPYITAYPWSAGFGSKYANPAANPGSDGTAVAFAPNGSAVGFGRAGGSYSTQYQGAYAWSAGFGTRYVATVGGSIYPKSVAFHSSTGYMAASGNNASPNLWVIPWSNSGFGTRLSDPASAPSGNVNGVAFSPDGNDIMAATGSSPYSAAYPFSSSGFGTRYSNPGTAIAGVAHGIAISPLGADVAFSHTSSPFVSVYPWSSGFGTKWTNPANVPPGTGTSVAFARAGNALAVASASSPYVAAYPWSGSGFGTKYADPGTAIGGVPQSPDSLGMGSPNIAFASDNSSVAIVHATSPYISAYPWDATNGFGTKYGDPGTAIAGTGKAVAFGTMYT